MYYRNQVGVWTYWSSGVTFPATASWKHVSWTTPPAPAGATAISFGLAVGSTGQVTTTGYSLATAPPDQMRTFIFIIIGLLIVAPFIGWKLWRRRPAGAGRPPAGGEPAGLAGGRTAGRQWMGTPPPHQLVVGPVTGSDSGEPGSPGPDPRE